MKVYVIKRNDGTYFDRCFDHYIRFADEVLFGEMFKLKGSAEEMMDFITRNKYKFNISKEELSIVEYSLMSETELSDYTNQVRKEAVSKVLDFIEEHKEYYFEKRDYYGAEYIFFNRSNLEKDILYQIQGEKK